MLTAIYQFNILTKSFRSLSLFLRREPDRISLGSRKMQLLQFESKIHIKLERENTLPQNNICQLQI